MARERRKKDIAPMGLLNTVYREKSNKEPSERELSRDRGANAGKSKKIVALKSEAKHVS